MITKKSTRTAELAAAVTPGQDDGPMTDANERREGAARAIELMTTWAGGGRSTDFMAERVAKIGTEEGNQGFARTFVGLAELSGQLLIRLSAAEPAMIAMGEFAAAPA